MLYLGKNGIWTVLPAAIATGNPDPDALVILYPSDRA